MTVAPPSGPRSPEPGWGAPSFPPGLTLHRPQAGPRAHGLHSHPTTHTTGSRQTTHPHPLARGDSTHPQTHSLRLPTPHGWGLLRLPSQSSAVTLGRLKRVRPGHAEQWGAQQKQPGVQTHGVDQPRQSTPPRGHSQPPKGAFPMPLRQLNQAQS